MKKACASGGVPNRPRGLDGVNADGIGIEGLSVQESRTPSPRKKSPAVTMSKGRQPHESHALRLAKSPMASTSYRPSLESRPSAAKKIRAGQPFGERTPPAGESRSCSGARGASSCTSHCTSTRRKPILGIGPRIRAAKADVDSRSIARNGPRTRTLSTTISTGPPHPEEA